MEVTKTNLHMLEEKASASKEDILEGELNLEPEKPDISQVYFSRGKVVVEELQPVEGMVILRGYVNYHILYFTKEAEGSLEGVEGRLPIEEKLSFPEVSRLDELYCDNTIEDFNIKVVNPRKIVMRLVIQYKVWSEEIKDSFISNDICGETPVEKQIRTIETASLLCCKQDMIKIRTEIAIPDNYPEVERGLWWELTTQEMQERCEEGLVKLSGSLRLQFLYCGEDIGNGPGIACYDAQSVISEALEVSGCKPDMIPCCQYTLENESVSILPNKEGEQRVLLIEGCLCIRLKLYEICKLPSLCNAYGTKKELVLEKESQEIPRLVRKVIGKQFLEKKVTTSVGTGKQEFMQLLCYEGTLYPVSWERQEDGLLLRGFLEVTVLMVIGEDEQPYFQEKISLPYEYHLEVDSMSPDCLVELRCHMEDLHVEVAQNGILEISAWVCFLAVVTKKQMLEQIGNVDEEPISREILEKLPDMMILRVGENEDMWSIGRRYYLSVEDICQQNELSEPTVEAGQKLILYRE